jgi:predicted GTPase
MSAIKNSPRPGLISEIAEARVASLDSAAIFDIVGHEGISLDAAIESVERTYRASLRKLSTEKLWAIVESL